MKNDRDDRANGAEFYTVNVNGEDVLFGAADFDKGELCLASWCGGEQCEGCGEDISETAVIDQTLRGHETIRCTCGASYRARHGIMIDGYVKDSGRKAVKR